MKKCLLIVLAFGLLSITSQAQASTLGIDDLAKGKIAVADQTYMPDPSTYIASNAVDGDTETLWNGGTGSPHWLKVDLGQTYSISHVDLYSAGFRGGTTFDLYYSNIDQAWNDVWTENANWTFIGHGALSYSNPLVSINFKGIDSRYLKYEVSSAGDWVALQEIAAYPAASVPIPAAIWLLGSGLIGLAGFRKKFKK
jgi:hypothetical protein